MPHHLHPKLMVVALPVISRPHPPLHSDRIHSTDRLECGSGRGHAAPSRPDQGGRVRRLLGVAEPGRRVARVVGRRRIRANQSEGIVEHDPSEAHPRAAAATVLCQVGKKGRSAPSPPFFPRGCHVCRHRFFSLEGCSLGIGPRLLVASLREI